MKKELLDTLEELSNGRLSLIGTWEGENINIDELNLEQLKGLVHLILADLDARNRGINERTVMEAARSRYNIVAKDTGRGIRL